MNRLTGLVGTVAAVLAIALAFGAEAADPQVTGSGNVERRRLPHLDGDLSKVFLTQGWGGSTSHNSSFTQYATDWDAGGPEGVPHAIYAVAEGDAQCNEPDPGLDQGLGNRVTVDRINSPHFDVYAHVPSCPFTTTHLEQGDFVSMTGESGCPGCGLHLHFQTGPVDIAGGQHASIGNSVADCLSGFCDFIDSTYAYDQFASDNAGPGLGAPGAIATKIRNTYVFLGHLLPAPCGDAWDCFEANDINGDGVQNFPGDTIAFAKATANPPLVVATMDFDLNGDGVINFPGDTILSAKIANQVAPIVCPAA